MINRNKKGNWTNEANEEDEEADSDEESELERELQHDNESQSDDEQHDESNTPSKDESQNDEEDVRENPAPSEEQGNTRPIRANAGAGVTRLEPPMKGKSYGNTKFQFMQKSDVNMEDDCGWFVKLKNIAVNACFTQMSAPKGIKRYGKLAIAAMLKEYKQLDDLLVFGPASHKPNQAEEMWKSKGENMCRWQCTEGIHIQGRLFFTHHIITSPICHLDNGLDRRKKSTDL